MNGTELLNHGTNPFQAMGINRGFAAVDGKLHDVFQIAALRTGE